jgi:hypothetical protein
MEKNGWFKKKSVSPGFVDGSHYFSGSFTGGSECEGY